MQPDYKKLKLKYNPFDPTGAGAPVKGDLWFSSNIRSKVDEFINEYRDGQGAKIMAVIGEYGTGKTCLLHWLHTDVLSNERILSFYFDNPGVQFYDLANTLFRTIGRKDFAKFIWELASSYEKAPYQGHLFEEGFEEYISSPRRKEDKDRITKWLQEAVLKSSVTDDEEIAYCLARLVTSTIEKPYFDYRDFVSGRKGSLVAEGEAAPYFSTVLKTICKGKNASAIAFLIDEFEEIGLQKQLTKRAAHGYLATLRRLISIAHGDGNDFWLVLSMTEDAYIATTSLEPALKDRGCYELRMEPLGSEDARDLIYSRLKPARSENGGKDQSIFPFPDKIPFAPSTYGNPRRLVRTCFHAIAHSQKDTKLPFEDSYLKDIEDKLYSAWL